MNKTARTISSIVSLLIFVILACIIFIAPVVDKKRAFGSGFHGMVISTMEGEKRDHRIIVEITNDRSKCFVLISPIKDKRLYPQYLDSMFKGSGSDIMYLKKDKKKEIIPMEDIDCLNIDCSVKK
jgi:hypothetical protein